MYGYKNYGTRVVIIIIFCSEIIQMCVDLRANTSETINYDTVFYFCSSSHSHGGVFNDEYIS